MDELRKRLFLERISTIGVLGYMIGWVGGVVTATIVEIPSYINEYRERQKRIHERETKIFAYVEEQMDKKDDEGI